MKKFLPTFFDKLQRVVVLASVIIVALSIGIWSFDSAQPLTVKSVTIASKEVEPGGYLRIDYEIEQNRQCGGDLHRFIVDGMNVIHFIEPYSFSRSNSTEIPSGPQSVRLAIPIPAAASPGQGKYQANIRYFCNPLQVVLDRPIEIQTPPVEFVITGETAPLVYRGKRIEDPRSTSIVHAALLTSIPASSYNTETLAFLGAPFICSSGHTPVRPHARYIDGRMIFVREHCPKVWKGPG